MKVAALVLALAGVVAAGLVAAVMGLPARDSVLLVAIAGGPALGAGLAGAGMLHLLQLRSFAAQVTTVALTSIGAVVAGVVAAGNAMFISTHDLSALLVVVTVAAVAGVVAALLLGARVGRASQALGRAAARLAHPDLSDDAVVPMSAEFRRLGDELERTARELEASRRREHQVEQARRDLMTWISHDLRTPLAGIRALSELLEDGLADPAQVQAHHRQLRVEAERLAVLVDDLFTVSRIQAGALTLELEAVDLGDLLSDALASAAPVAARRGVRLVGHVARPAPHVDASPSALSRVIGNLVSNALRETPAGGTVLVEAGLDDQRDGEGERAWVAVEDSCGGIPAEVLERVFEPAYRGQPARTPREDGGAGLGLAIARGLVEAHGGTLLGANVDGGCRFTARIPVAGTAAAGG